MVLWRNGFTINDGPFRRLDDPENAPFLESIRKSECPKKLEPADRRSFVHVNLMRRDKNYIEYEKHQVPLERERHQVPFQAVGRTLSSNTSQLLTPLPTLIQSLRWA